MTTMATWIVTAVIALGLPLLGEAQTSTSDAPKAASKGLGEADTKFVTKAASGGMAEVELGRLASERGSAEAVKQFGQRMVTDHRKANEELARLAQRKGVTLPSEMDPEHKKVVDRLSKLSGSEFDRAYSREMQRDHDENVKDFQRQAQTGSDADLKAWAAKTLPVLQEHQRQARQLAATAGGSPGGTSPGASPSASPPTSGAGPSPSGSSSPPSSSK